MIGYSISIHCALHSCSTYVTLHLRHARMQRIHPVGWQVNDAFNADGLSPAPFNELFKRGRKCPRSAFYQKMAPSTFPKMFLSLLVLYAVIEAISAQLDYCQIHAMHVLCKFKVIMQVRKDLSLNLSKLIDCLFPFKFYLQFQFINPVNLFQSSMNTAPVVIMRSPKNSKSQTKTR